MKLTRIRIRLPEPHNGFQSIIDHFLDVLTDSQWENVNRAIDGRIQAKIFRVAPKPVRPAVLNKLHNSVGKYQRHL